MLLLTPFICATSAVIAILKLTVNITEGNGKHIAFDDSTKAMHYKQRRKMKVDNIDAAFGK